MSNPPLNEADFVGWAHDQQMKAKTRREALYFQLHKEMTPVLIRVMEEALASEAPAHRSVETAMVYSQFVAASLLSVATQLAELEKAGPQKQQAILQSLFAAVQTYSQNGLESATKATI